jgi:predicted Fe-Mo cluster-binding NifX family protein
MLIGVTSQNFRTITGHAGKSRRVLIYGQDSSGRVVEEDRIDLPSGMSMHDHHGDDHPFYQLDVLITGSCGQGFNRRMQEQGVRVITTSETDPITAASQVIAGETLPAAEIHEHGHPASQPGNNLAVPIIKLS